MRRQAALLLAHALLLAACAPPCTPADSLSMTGDPPPPLTDAVIAAAQARCGRTLVGVIEWRRELNATTGAVGYCAWEADGCPMQAWVALPGGEWTLPLDASPDACEPGGDLRATAICTSLAHELGHWCLRTEDEDRAEGFGQEVLADAVGRGAS